MDIQIKEKKTRKPRLAKIVASIVKIQSMDKIINEEVALEEVAVEVAVEGVETETVEVVESVDCALIPEVIPLTCIPCKKTFRRNSIAIVERHNRSIYHQRSLLRVAKAQ
jgi:hypothetical protein